MYCSVSAKGQETFEVNEQGAPTTERATTHEEILNHLFVQASIYVLMR